MERRSRARWTQLLQLALLAHAAVASLHRHHSHRRLQHDWYTMLWGHAEDAPASQRGMLDVQLPEAGTSGGEDELRLAGSLQAAAQPRSWLGRRRRQQEAQQQLVLHGETPEHSARAAAIMDELLQDILDAEGAVVAHRDLRCTCQYGSAPGAWLPAAASGSAGAAWSPLDGDCQVGDLLSSEALRERADESSGVLQVGGCGAPARPAAGMRCWLQLWRG